MSVERPTSPIELMQSLGWKISGPFYQTVPAAKTEYISRCKGDVDSLRDHLLKSVIIEDGILEHSERRKLEGEYPAIGQFSHRYSKLGGNILNNMLFHMEEVIEKCRREDEEKGSELEKTASLEDLRRDLAGYKNLDFAGKVSFARRVDDVIYKFLLALSK